MKKVKKILKRILLGLLIIGFAGIAIFVTAGLIPEKNLLTSAGMKQRQSTYVTMKDGTRIAVRIILPDSLEKEEKVPAIMETTRYGSKYKRSFILNALTNLGIAHEIPPAIIPTLLDSKYAFVMVDARGSGASFGTREMEWSREEIDDMGQVIGWITKQEWSDGKVGAYGISYSGNTAELAAAAGNPALLASAPLYPDFDVMSQAAMPGGIFNEKLIREWNDANMLIDSNKEKSIFNGGIAPVDGDRFGSMLKQAIAGHNTFDIFSALKNSTYSDDILNEDYTINSLSPYSYKDQIEKSGIPLYSRAGWMDSGTVNGAIERFLTYDNDQTLIIGPWSHGGWHFCDPFLNRPVSKRELDKAQAAEVTAFFDKYLKPNGNKTAKSGKEILYYTFGEGKWKKTDKWPVEGFDNKIFYFAADGKLSGTKSAETSGSDSYKVDFTATTGETNRWRTNLGGGAVIYPDRTEEDKKLLTYTSDVLQSDIEITGVPVVTLNITSTATDGAFYVYLEDVAPDGKVTYITEGELRALHRKTTKGDLGYETVGPKRSYRKKDGESLKPGENTELRIGMQATSVLLRKGHKIRIAIAGHDASNFARVPESGDPVITIQRNSILYSSVELPIRER